MRFRSIITLSLLTGLLVVGCAPATVPEPAQPAMPVTEEPQQAPPAPTATLAPPAATEPAPTEMPSVEPQAVATSRGPNLEATDPATVSLASGELQLVEFFRFT